MLVPSDSYKYCSWESKWLLTWLTRVFPSSSFLDGLDSNNSGIFLTGPNLHNNRVSIEIGSENKQIETKRKEKQWLTRPHAGHTRPGGFLRTNPTRACPRVASQADASQRRQVERFACGAGRAGRIYMPDACPLQGEDAPHQPVIDTCRSPILPRSSARQPTRGGASTLSPTFFHFSGLFHVSIYFLPIFLSSNM